MSKINNTELISEFKSRGYDVSINHFRKFGNMTMTRFLANQLIKSKQMVLPLLENNGGYTVGIVKKGNEKYIAVAKCCDFDQFNYRHGTMIVLNRIKAQIQKDIDNCRVKEPERAFSSFNYIENAPQKFKKKEDEVPF